MSARVEPVHRGRDKSPLDRYEYDVVDDVKGTVACFRYNGAPGHYQRALALASALSRGGAARERALREYPR